MKILKTRLVLLLLLASSFPVLAEITPSAVFRADLFMIASGTDIRQAGILDTRLKLDSQSEFWRFKADANLAFYTGFITNISGRMTGKLTSAYIRYSPVIGSFTVGKAYPKLGLLNLFNPFEWDKQIDLSDISAEKEGIIQVGYENSGNSLSQFKIALVPGDSPKKTAGAAQFIYSSSIGDTGLVLSRKRSDRNTTGLFFKGDLLLGWNASFAFHFGDNIQDNHNEASLGADYSFFDGRLFLTCLGYWSELGAAIKADQIPRNADKYMVARTYGYANASWSPDEFSSYKTDLFWNTTDNSMMIIPSASFVLANGLGLSSLFAVPTGRGTNEFSRARSGYITVDLRLEAKM